MRNAALHISDWVEVDNVIVTVVYYSQQSTLHRYNKLLGRFERRVTGRCTDTTHPDHLRPDWWEVAAPDPAILIPGATRTATEYIRFPAPDISPSGDVAVNLGMWLAVEPAGPYVARAAFSDSVWAETTATLVSTTFDPDDGSPPIVCQGYGTPIPDSRQSDVEPGPCGHVYSDYADIGSHTMTITSTWQVAWRLSSGATGRAPDITVTTEHDFEVFEVQTVGSG